MEYLLEIIIVGQCMVLLWLFLNLEEVRENLDLVIDAHNEMADGFQELLEIMYEEHKDEK